MQQTPRVQGSCSLRCHHCYPDTGNQKIHLIHHKVRSPGCEKAPGFAGEHSRMPGAATWWRGCAACCMCSPADCLNDAFRLLTDNHLLLVTCITCYSSSQVSESPSLTLPKKIPYPSHWHASEKSLFHTTPPLAVEQLSLLSTQHLLALLPPTRPQLMSRLQAHWSILRNFSCPKTFMEPSKQRWAERGGRNSNTASLPAGSPSAVQPNSPLTSLLKSAGDELVCMAPATGAPGSSAAITLMPAGSFQGHGSFLVSFVFHACS